MFKLLNNIYDKLVGRTPRLAVYTDLDGTVRLKKVYISTNSTNCQYILWFHDGFINTTRHTIRIRGTWHFTECFIEDGKEHLIHNQKVRNEAFKIWNKEGF